jgi:hypothetical protein
MIGDTIPLAGLLPAASPRLRSKTSISLLANKRSFAIIPRTLMTYLEFKTTLQRHLELHDGEQP